MTTWLTSDTHFERDFARRWNAVVARWTIRTGGCNTCMENRSEVIAAGDAAATSVVPDCPVVRTGCENMMILRCYAVYLTCRRI